jgi:spermidine synthase
MPLLNLPQTLYKTQSPISGEIKVIQLGTERRLVVGGLTQSINFDAPDVDERIWGKIVGEVQNSKFKVQNSLILGLGGGTIAHLLTQKCGPIPIDAVEVDPAIVTIGKKYFDLDKLPNLNIIIADAIEFVRNQAITPKPLAPLGFRASNQQYSLVIVDLYCGEKYPPGAESNSFFAGLKALLHPKGVVLVNRVSTKEDAKFEEKLKRNFGKFKKTIVPSKFGGENIIYCS